MILHKMSIHIPPFQNLFLKNNYYCCYYLLLCVKIYVNVLKLNQIIIFGKPAVTFSSEKLSYFTFYFIVFFQWLLLLLLFAV